MINGSTEDINANLREIILLLNDKVSNLREKDGLDFVIISLRNLTIYTSGVPGFVIDKKPSLISNSSDAFCPINSLALEGSESM